MHTNFRMEARILKSAKHRPGIFCFCIVYNEAWFLPYFLEHYRALGISHFVFLDDRSTDQTRDILMGQDDCTLIVLEGQSSPAPDAMSVQTMLMNAAVEQSGHGAWSLTVDADEFLILPEEFSAVDDVVRYLEARHLSCALAAMIDFYPQRLSERFYDPLTPLAGSPWFDRLPGFVRPLDQDTPVPTGNGVRPRLLRMLADRHPETFRKLYANVPYRFARSWKVPLLKRGAGVRRINPHMVNVQPPFDIQLGLAHFKFYPGLDTRIADALDRRAHYLGAIEYEFLKAALDHFADEPLICHQSAKYDAPGDLQAAGLIWVGDARAN